MVLDNLLAIGKACEFISSQVFRDRLNSSNKVLNCLWIVPILYAIFEIEEGKLYLSHLSSCQYLSFLAFLPLYCAEAFCS